jgi:hypothetical protein
MRDQSKFLVSLLTLKGFAGLVAILGLWVLGLAMSPCAMAQNHILVPVQASKSTKLFHVLSPQHNAISACVVAATKSPLLPVAATTATVAAANPPRLQVQDPVPFIPATQAFQAPACSASELGGITIDILNITSINFPSPARLNPEWKAIIVDPTLAPNRQPPQIVEGVVGPTENHNTDQQATAEVAEEDIAWTHYTHDWTFKLTPDPAYQRVLSSWVRFPGKFEGSLTRPPDQLGCPENFILVTDPDNPDLETCVGCPGGELITGDNRCQIAAAEICPDGTTGETCHHTDMEVEWDNAALMDASDKEGFARDFGAVPEFVWPSVGDRVWVEGRWIFDCGHPGTPDADSNNPQFVKFGSEIHPPRVLATFRANRVALDSFPRPRVSAPNFPFPQSFLPVTGAPADPDAIPAGKPNNGPTQIPTTEADIYVSVNAGGAGDICSVVPSPCSSFGGHTGPIVPVNDRNYMFDVYPPGTDFAHQNADGTFPVTPPVPDASLQWRFVDHFSELPLRACGGFDNSVCVTVNPIVCLVGASTAPPPRDAVEQTNAGVACPALKDGEQPTRVRVILPFAGSNANFFAKSLLLGWDDVPTPANNTKGVRTFQVRLHELRRIHDGDTGDWREFISVGGQWRYITPYFDTDHGIAFFNGGDNTCDVGIIDSILGQDCFNFDNTPWTISVRDGDPIHVAVGGFAARGLEDDSSALFLCRDQVNGCDQPTDILSQGASFLALATDNDDRIGTYEFDLAGPDYAPPPPHTTEEFGCQIHTGLTSCNLQYRVAFNVKEITPTTPAPTSGLTVGTPQFDQFVSSATPLTLSSPAVDAEGFQYRARRIGINPPPNGFPLPVYPSTEPFPVHWTHADLPAGSQSVAVNLTGDDDSYSFQWSAESFGNLLDARQSMALVLDNTAPVITINQPTATQYTHADTLAIDFNVDDGSGSGVKTSGAKIDGNPTLRDGRVIANGIKIDLFSELSLGTHTFSVTATDNVDNTSTKSVTFSIIVTPDSLEQDVNLLLGFGCIDTSGIGNSLVSKIEAAKARIAAGDTHSAINTLSALLSQLQTQAGKHISTSCTDPNTNTQFNPAQVLITDLQALLATLKTAGVTDPILGYVLNGVDGVGGAVVTLFDATNGVVATANTDSTGFYFFAQTSTLVTGTSYTVRVTIIPKSTATPNPASQTFTWSAEPVSLANFLLN